MISSLQKPSLALAAISYLSVALAQVSKGDDDLLKELKKSGELMKGIAAKGLSWTCRPTKAFSCSSESCSDTKPTTWAKFNLKRNTNDTWWEVQYSRCDIKGCDNYAATLSPSGIFSSLTSEGRFWLKMKNDGSEYFEVVSMGVSTQQYFGECKPK